jgi:hypothetical protein
VGYAQERTALWTRAGKAGQGRAAAELFRLDPRALRFHLGTALADLRVPVVVDGALTALFEEAGLDLFFLLCMRHRAGLRDGDYDQLLLRDGFDPKALRPVSYGAPAQVSREGIRRAFLEAPELHPALDAGLIAGWIAQGRPGRRLLSALSTLLARAREEQAASDQGGTAAREPTVYLALLALRAYAENAVAEVKQVAIAPTLARPLLGAVAAGLLVATRLAMREAEISENDLQSQACALPLPWLQGGKLLFGSGLAAYGVQLSEAPLNFEQKIARLVAGGTADTIARTALVELQGQGEVQVQKTERLGALAFLRAELFGSLKQVEMGRSPALSIDGLTQPQLFGLPGALERVMATPERRKELAQRAAQAAKSCTHEQARSRLDTIATAAEEWSDDHPGKSWLPPSAPQKLVAQAIAALVVDTACDRLLDQSARGLSHRSGAESEDGLAIEHERGRLYWFGFAGRPILTARAGSTQMGHLFCDVKDFTKRTAMLKEAVVADFLQREFYQPILTAAARHHHGAGHLGDKGGLYLNNLLGDAVSFSGDISALVELASEIRAALQSYAKRLEGDASHDAISRSAHDIEERVGARRQVLEKSIASAMRAAEQGTIDAESGEEPRTRLRMLHQELQRLEDEREQELALVRGEKLDAGIFISFGAAPEVATFEDHIFGSIKVAIAEKINESARGTARNGGVRARIDMLLQAARAQKRKASVSCPLSVFLAQPLSIPVSPDLEHQVRGALELGDLAGAESILRESVHSFVERLAHEAGSTSGGGGDIYNGGAALSEEALNAYLSARKNQDVVLIRRDIPVASLHARLNEKFIFPQQQLSLVMVAERQSQDLSELFVFSGRALFRGLEKEGGLAVYEMIPRSSPFFQLLAAHHVGKWLAREVGGR